MPPKCLFNGEVIQLQMHHKQRQSLRNTLGMMNLNLKSLNVRIKPFLSQIDMDISQGQEGNTESNMKLVVQPKHT